MNRLFDFTSFQILRHRDGRTQCVYGEAFGCTCIVEGGPFTLVEDDEVGDYIAGVGTVEDQP